MPQRGVKGRVFEKMKKFLSSALVLLLVLVGLFAMSGCESKPVLRLYNWYDYMDESILKEFEKEYGCTVRVSYFTDNEGMLTKLQAPGANYDLLFPSDYTVQRLIALDMLAELNHANIPNIENIDKKYLDMSYDMGGKYSVPYMWGTVGILYNKNKVSDEVNSWDILWNEKYADEIYMLDSSRDSIGVALMRRGYGLNDRSDEALAAAKEELIKQKPMVKSYYVDETKGMMAKGNGALGVVYSGDAIIAMAEADFLDYALPEGGTNVWFDAVCIPKSSTNKELAEKFIDFLCRGDIAFRNADYIGYCTPNKLAYEQLDEEIKNNKKIYPDEEYLKKCEVFVDLGDKADDFDKLWLSVTSGK